MNVMIKSSAGRSKNLVFTSAGDRSNVSLWLSGRRDFDLWIVYYGDSPQRYRDVADIYMQHKGTKFPNLHVCYALAPEVIARYEAVMVMDDDVVIHGSGISRLFEVRAREDLWALAPAFRSSGLVSWEVTRLQPSCKLRYTNYIEMTAPLFRRDKLDAFMRVYDPLLTGYGADWWFLHSFGPDSAGRIAVVDEVPCINPYARTKGGQREIDRVQSHEERKRIWRQIQQTYGVPEIRSFVEYGRVERGPIGKFLNTARYLPEELHFKAKQLARRFISHQA